MQDLICNDSASILTRTLEEMKKELGDKFSLETINLAELERRTGITRSRLRTLKKKGFKEDAHPLKGKKAAHTVLSDYTSLIDHWLQNGSYNSTVFYDLLKPLGYTGSISRIKEYMHAHKYLLPAKRQAVDPQGNRGRRYFTGPGEAFQMDWGFVKVSCVDGKEVQIACFAMICHHCGERYIEFFPNAKQENLFIGMLHGFAYMGIPKRVLTDNMKSVVIRRDSEKHPIWQRDYEEFMRTIGFETTLCKPRHPFTKGSVERLVRFVKENFLLERVFVNITDLNEQAKDWANTQNAHFHKSLGYVPGDEHFSSCVQGIKPLERTIEVAMYLCPVRKISFDGFVTYEGRRFGVPYWYTEHTCRVKREKDLLTIYDTNLSTVLVTHPITWSRKDSYCKDQFEGNQPEELPSVKVKTLIQESIPAKHLSGFSKFNFEYEEDFENE